MPKHHALYNLSKNIYAFFVWGIFELGNNTAGRLIPSLCNAENKRVFGALHSLTHIDKRIKRIADRESYSGKNRAEPAREVDEMSAIWKLVSENYEF